MLHQTSSPASWATCHQIRTLLLGLDMLLSCLFNQMELFLSCCQLSWIHDTIHLWSVSSFIGLNFQFCCLEHFHISYCWNCVSCYFLLLRFCGSAWINTRKLNLDEYTNNLIKHHMNRKLCDSLLPLADAWMLTCLWAPLSRCLERALYRCSITLHYVTYTIMLLVAVWYYQSYLPQEVFFICIAWDCLHHGLMSGRLGLVSRSILFNRQDHSNLGCSEAIMCEEWSLVCGRLWIRGLGLLTMIVLFPLLEQEISPLSQMQWIYKSNAMQYKLHYIQCWTLPTGASTS